MRLSKTTFIALIGLLPAAAQAGGLPQYDLIDHCEMASDNVSAAQQQQSYNDCVYYETESYKQIDEIWNLSSPAAQAECGPVAANDNHGSYFTLRKCLLDYKPPKAAPQPAAPVKK